eukprot:2771405-Amphidinium_carterae.1
MEEDEVFGKTKVTDGQLEMGLSVARVVPLRTFHGCGVLHDNGAEIMHKIDGTHVLYNVVQLRYVLNAFLDGVDRMFLVKHAGYDLHQPQSWPRDPRAQVVRQCIPGSTFIYRN